MNLTQQRRIVTCLFMVHLFGAGTDNVSAGENLKRTDAFEVAFGMSFTVYDWCGDARAGEIARKAMVEKFDHCPFSPKARDHFRDRIGILRKQAGLELNKLIIKNGGLPDRLPWMTKSCQEIFSTPQYREWRSMFERYDRGELAVDEIFPDRCDVSAGAP